jgi:hypothetical protein
VSEVQTRAEGDLRRGRRRGVGVALMLVGAVALLWSVLQLSSAGFGTSPTPSFAQRRSYDRIKSEVHQVFPEALVRALLGFALLVAGNRLLTKVDEGALAEAGSGAGEG